MCNSRIYDEKIFKDKIEKLRTEYYYCPHCFANNLTSITSGGAILIHDYLCINCNETFDIILALTKTEIRELKLNKLLSN